MTTKLHSDRTLRKSLHDLYVALFHARKASPVEFHDSKTTTVFTAVMGLESLTWRVVGITPEALDLLATVAFDKAKLPRKLCRGHKKDRIDTMRFMFHRDEPLSEDAFFDAFLASDPVVIMTNEQNVHTTRFPTYIEIDNRTGELFPNGSLMGWKHRKKEREFLRRLHQEQRA